MNRLTETDIGNIYGNNIEPDLLARVISNFDSLLSINSSFYLKCRNESDELMSHFSLFHSERNDRVVFAGALDKNLNGNIVPIIRFSNKNIALRIIQPGFTFPYKKPNENWSNVEIRNETINRLDILLFAQAQWFSDNYLNGV